MTSQPDARLYFLDNLRAAMILLVVLSHACVVYESSGLGALIWIVHDPSTNDLVGILSLIIDIFAMATIFFISGYLAPGSLERKGAREFLRTRFSRVIVPWILAVFTLMPMYKMIFLYSRGLPQEDWTSYFHFSNGIISQSWLWFLPVLFLFDALYVLLSRVDWVPVRMSLKSAIAAFCVAGFVISFGMDMRGLLGWTKTALIDFQNERLVVYFLVFLLGSLCYRQQVFASKPAAKSLYIAISAITWIPIGTYVLFLIVPFVIPDGVLVGPVADRVLLWLSFFAALLSMLYVLLETFRRYFDRPGKIRDELSRNAYSVYIIHVIVLGGLAMLLLDANIPSLLKYVTLAASTYLVSNLVVSMWRRATQIDPLDAMRAE